MSAGQLSPIIDTCMSWYYLSYAMDSVVIWRHVHTRTCTLYMVTLTFQRKIDSIMYHNKYALCINPKELL